MQTIITPYNMPILFTRILPKKLISVTRLDLSQEAKMISQQTSLCLEQTLPLGYVHLIKYLYPLQVAGLNLHLIVSERKVQFIKNVFIWSL